MLSKLEIIINGEYSLWLPAQGLDISLIKNEFNLLTNNVSGNRPLSITETFEIPLDENQRIFDRLKGQKKIAELKYNDIVLIAGPISEYSVDEQNKKILITITSLFKQVVDYMGDNILYLDKIDLSRWNHTVGEFDKNKSNDLLKWGYYNPMDNSTGKIEFNQSNINDYCKPSINLMGYFKEVFRINGWNANWEQWSLKQQNTVLMPTTPYKCSSWGFNLAGSYTIEPNGELQIMIPQNMARWNIVSKILDIDTPGAEITATGALQIRQPSRQMSFRVKAIHSSMDPFDLILKDGENEIGSMQSVGNTIINYESDSINLKEGIDPLTLTLRNPLPRQITIDFSSFDFYNLFSIYETNDDDFLPPQGYMYTVCDNYPKITALELYREFLTLFQMAQTADDGMQQVSYYMINDIPNKDFERVDVNPFLFWNGYTILSEKISGLAKLNAIRYKGDTGRSRYFEVDIAPLPASATYFESMFAHGETVKSWNSVSIPSLKYKVKETDGLSIEYLEYSDTPPQLGYYDHQAGAMLFEPLHMTRIVGEYWNNLLTMLSSFDGYNPVVYKLRLRLYYYQYLNLFGQRNLFYYNSDAILIDGSYDVINQTFEGTFLSLR